jgi:hypothetical protein
MRTTLLSGLAVLLVAAGCTAGEQPSHPATTATATATAPATTDPTAALRRPLRLPTVGPGDRCPVTRRHQVEPAFAAVLGNGPAYPTDSARSWRDGRAEGGWYHAKVLWVADPAHPGPFLVHGGRLDGGWELRFGEGPQPDGELLLPAGGTARSPDSDWFNWPSYTRLRGGGCYAYQVEDASGSQVIVFQA